LAQPRAAQILQSLKPLTKWETKVALLFITDPANFAPPTGTRADFVDWARYPDGVPLDFKGQPEFKDLTDITGLEFGLFIKNGHLTRRTQDGGPSWNGSFTAGDALLFTDSTPGPLHISFVGSIRGASMQLNIKDPVSHFRIGISAFADAKKLPVPKAGTRTDGVFSNAGDGSAAWLGVLEDNPNRPALTRIVLSVTVLDSGYVGDSSFAINKLNLVV
jgi:hypothetical protein